MFTFGIVFVFVGYAIAYTGIANAINGGQGPSFAQSLGFPLDQGIDPATDIPYGETRMNGKPMDRGGGKWVIR